jgi:hypothetical protein
MLSPALTQQASQQAAMSKMQRKMVGMQYDHQLQQLSQAKYELTEPEEKPILDAVTEYVQVLQESRTATEKLFDANEKLNAAILKVLEDKGA